MRKRWRIALATLVVTLPALFVPALTSSPASAHGAAIIPGSRTFLCWEDGLTPTGEIVPKNPACAAAVAQSGTTSLFNWFAVLRSDGAGRTQGFIPDGRLCSGAATVFDFEGFNLPRDDWPLTHLTAGANIEFRYNKWAAHPGSFREYITKDSWSPTRPLTWDDLEPTPFSEVTDPPSVGNPGNVESYYHWNATLPANKTGRHLIYSVWTRSDSNETFYGCSDVVFDGGNGEVTGVGQGNGNTTPGTCTATLRVTNSWSGGFQAEGTVTNTGTSALFGWTVSWISPSGVTVASAWNGTFTPAGDLATIRSVDWNRSLAAGASTTFGFTGNSSGTPTLPTASCSSP
ncbi:MAG TPA: lytic polysaccharide monooxygenase [Streptosporangiaceae bacterium]|nr:lytic polysaccharide monooxygenase [Streptosporangiaceae bacterium]